MLYSDYCELCSVTLPYLGRQKYMHTFDLSAPRMADGFGDYLEPVMVLCAAAGAHRGLAHMTVDEKVINDRVGRMAVTISRWPNSGAWR